MSIRKALQSARVYCRAKRIKSNSWRYFENAVYHCARVSAANKELSFCVCHSGIFGGPKVLLCDSNELICLSEYDTCAVVRNGVVYQMNKYAVH